MNTLAIAVVIAIAFAYSLSPIKVPKLGVQTILATAFFLSGRVFHQMRLQIPLWVGIAGFALVLVCAILLNRGLSISGVIGCQVPVFFATSILGIVGTMVLSSRIKGYLARLLDYTGQQTLMILTLHFLAFKLISLTKIYAQGLPIENLAQFPAIAANNSWWWLAYALAGVGLPLLVCKVVDYFKQKIIKQ